MTAKLMLMMLILASFGFNLIAQNKNSGIKNLKENVIQAEHKFDPKRDAQKDIDNAIIKAQKLNKRILLDVGGEWCIWCRRLDSLFANNPDLSKFMYDNYEVVKVNYSPENKNEKVLSHYPKIPGYPHIFILDKNGKLLRSEDTSLLESGKGHDKNKVMAFLKEWAPKKVSSMKKETKN